MNVPRDTFTTFECFLAQWMLTTVAKAVCANAIRTALAVATVMILLLMTLLSVVPRCLDAVSGLSLSREIESEVVVVSEEGVGYWPRARPT